eukprot:4209169-Pleurochrysis_carterae.AAC.1
MGTARIPVSMMTKVWAICCPSSPKYLSMHREGNAVPCLVTHASERGKMVDHRGEVSGAALALRVA